MYKSLKSVNRTSVTGRTIIAFMVGALLFFFSPIVNLPASADTLSDYTINNNLSKIAIVTYNDLTMDGGGLQNVKDGDPATQFLQTVPQNPDIPLDNHYIQFNWEEPVSVNQVVLSSDWCYNTDSGYPVGQAPTNWDIYVSENGVDDWKLVASTGDITWDTCSDYVESKVLQFEKADSIKGLRVKINDVPRSWEKYVIKEIYIACTPEDQDDEDTTPEVIKHAPNATITYNDALMSGMGLQLINNGILTDGYVSEDNPDMENQYIQFNWDNPVEFNRIVLYSQYCGTDTASGQAPTSWDIYTSVDGEGGWTKVAESGKITWQAGDDVQSKAVNTGKQTGVKGVRIVITSAKLEWNHYYIAEVEINYDPDAEEPPETTPEPGDPSDDEDDQEEDKSDEPAKTVKHAGNAIVTYNDGVMTGMGLQHVKDGSLSTSYVSEDNPDMSNQNQFIQFNWDSPIDFNQVVLASQYCGGAGTPGQAPTAWEVLVSENGTDGWRRVARTGKIQWEAGDHVQSHALNIERVKGIMGVRIVITDANLDWNHYAIYEIEINNVPNNNPKTGDYTVIAALIALIASIAVPSAVFISRNSLKNRIWQ